MLSSFSKKLTAPLLAICILICCLCSSTESSDVKHTNNWAVIVDTSRFWFNYRHAANALSIYRSVKRLGIPDRYT
jgi:phosphatidylinositol glycan class K